MQCGWASPGWRLCTAIDILDWRDCELLVELCMGVLRALHCQAEAHWVALLASVHID